MFKFLFFLLAIFVVGAVILAAWPIFLIGGVLYLIFRRPICRC
jgi:hypothetical protein